MSKSRSWEAILGGMIGWRFVLGWMPTHVVNQNARNAKKGNLEEGVGYVQRYVSRQGER
jgi:hypothetical protein